MSSRRRRKPRGNVGHPTHGTPPPQATTNEVELRRLARMSPDEAQAYVARHRNDQP